jgi:hypothetical protein
MKAIIASLIMFAVALAVSSEAYAGNGFLAIMQKPSGLLVLVVGIVIGAIAVSLWRRMR